MQTRGRRALAWHRARLAEAGAFLERERAPHRRLSHGEVRAAQLIKSRRSDADERHQRLICHGRSHRYAQTVFEARWVAGCLGTCVPRTLCARARGRSWACARVRGMCARNDLTRRGLGRATLSAMEATCSWRASGARMRMRSALSRHCCIACFCRRGRLRSPQYTRWQNMQLMHVAYFGFSHIGHGSVPVSWSARCSLTVWAVSSRSREALGQGGRRLSPRAAVVGARSAHHTSCPSVHTEAPALPELPAVMLYGAVSLLLRGSLPTLALPQNSRRLHASADLGAMLESNAQSGGAGGGGAERCP